MGAFGPRARVTAAPWAPVIAELGFLSKVEDPTAEMTAAQGTTDTPVPMAEPVDLEMVVD